MSSPQQQEKDLMALIKARIEMLSSMPLPPNAEEIADMTLSPIMLPPQVTLHEFLNAAPPVRPVPFRYIRH